MKQDGIFAIRIVGLIFSSLAAIFAIGMSILLFFELRTNPDQMLWPFPVGYLIEISLLALLAAIARWLDLPATPIILWAVAGITFAFCFWGAMTIGLFYLPSFLLLFITAILESIRHKGRLWLNLAAGFAGALGQSAFIWFLIWINQLLTPTHFP